MVNGERRDVIVALVQEIDDALLEAVRDRYPDITGAELLSVAYSFVLSVSHNMMKLYPTSQKSVESMAQRLLLDVSLPGDQKKPSQVN